MRWHSALPDRLGALAALALDRWRRLRHGDPPKCGVTSCSCRAHFAYGRYDPEYRCVGCAFLGREPSGPLVKRDVRCPEDWGRSS